MFYQAGVDVSMQVLNSAFLSFIRGDLRFGDRLDGAALVAPISSTSRSTAPTAVDILDCA